MDQEVIAGTLHLLWFSCVLENSWVKTESIYCINTVSSLQPERIQGQEHRLCWRENTLSTALYIEHHRFYKLLKSRAQKLNSISRNWNAPGRSSLKLFGNAPKEASAAGHWQGTGGLSRVGIVLSACQFPKLGWEQQSCLLNGLGG